MKKLLPLILVCISVQAGRAQNVVTTRPEGSRVRLTIAQEGLSLVSDQRTVDLKEGNNLVRFPGVAPRLEPHTVQPVLAGPAAVEILEQRFRYDLRDLKQVLRRYVGQKVTLLRTNAPALTGTLVAAEEMILLDTQEGVLINPEGTFSVPGVAEGLVMTPTLEWLVKASTAGQYTIEARYGAAGLSWKASYRASLNATEDRLTLRGWLEIMNDAGAEYKAAEVVLRAEKAGQPLATFPVNRRIDLPRHEALQMSYLTVPDLPVTKESVFFASEAQPDLGKPYSAQPTVMLRLRNTLDYGLGVPLPSGPLILWGAAADGSLRQLTTWDLPYTAVNQRVWIPRGTAAPISATRSQATGRQLNPLTNEYTVQTTLTSMGTDAVTVSVVERLSGSAKITESTTPPIPLEPNLVEFKVEVPPKGTATLKYVLEVKKEAA